jgi:hypothetical protein
MIKKLLLPVSLALIFFLWILSIPAGASPHAQATPFPTPTPGGDGRILYTVLAGDSQWLVAAKFNLDIEQLRLLNNWTVDEILIEGQVILLGLASQQDPTAQPTAQSEATPEGIPESPGSGMICILLFDDLNGDALRQESEFGIVSGAVSVSQRAGEASRSGTTMDEIDVDEEPVPTCFEELPIGEYTISVAAPEGYNPTTAQSATLELKAGDETRLNFGAQLGSAAQSEILTPEEGGRSPLMGLLGFVLLLSGTGLGLYTWQLSRRR